MTNFGAVMPPTIEGNNPSTDSLFGSGRLDRMVAWRWIFIALLGFICAQITSVGLLYAVAAVKGDSSAVGAFSKLASPPQWVVLSSLLGLWIGFIGAPVVASRLQGAPTALGFSFRWIDLAGVGVGIASQLLIGLIYRPFIRHIKDFSGPVHKLTGSSHGAGLWVIALFTVIGAPIAEELFFRGLLYRGLEGSIVGGRGAAYIATSIGAIVLDGTLFGAAHFELAQFAGLAIFGAILATVFRLTGRLGMSIVSHATFNALAIISVATTGSFLWHL